MTKFLKRRRRVWPRVLLGLFVLVLCLAAAVYYNPFWLIDHGVKAYLKGHGVQDSYVDVSGNQIHYLEAKPLGGGPEKPILLVHGLGARATDWAPLIPGMVSHGYHVYALDLLGYGESDKPRDGDFSLSGEEHVVEGFMQKMHLQKADVAGWSMGGWISMMFTLDHPEQVRRLLLYDSAGLYFDPDFNASLFAPNDKAGLQKLIARIEPDKPLIQVPAFAASGMLRRMQASRWIVQSSFRSMISGRHVLDFRVSQITQPVLIVWGTEDKLTPWDQAQKLHQSMPQSMLFGFAGCGHLAAAECAKQVLPVTLHFLDAEPPLPAAQVIVPAATSRQ